MKTRFILITALILIFAFNASALFAAQQAEYYVYNGFDAVLGAFQKIALIFGDNGYKTLFFGIIVLGIMFGGFAVFAKIAMGARSSPLSWAIPATLGIALYLALFIPKGTVNLYDPVKNKFQAIGGIPDGIVVLVGTLNSIERGLVEIISTAGAPMSYQEQAGGVGFDMFNIIGSKGVLLADKNIHNNLKEYVDKCLLFELTRPGTTLTINQLANNTDFIPLFEQGMNPAIYTIYYSAAHPEGVTMQCSLAWPGIAADISLVGNYTAPLKEMCAAAGFDPTNATEFNQCQETLSNTTNYLWGAAYENILVLRQVLMSETINDVITSASPDTAIRILASRNTGNQWLSSGMVANDFIPILRAALTAIAIGMIPFFVLFIPTPVVGKALLLISGMFIWLTSWGITDAVIHQFAVEYGRKAFYDVVNYGLGMTSISNFSTASMKTMAAFAAMRWSGLMLATVMTGILIKFGGQALAMLAGGLTGGVSAAASSAGREVVTPEGSAHTISGLETTGAAWANAHKYSYEERNAIKTAQKVGETGAMNEVIDNMGAGGVEKMVGSSTVGRMVKYGASGQAARNRGIGETFQDLTMAGGVGISKDVGGSKAELDNYESLKETGTLPTNTTFEEFQRMQRLSPKVNTPDGVQTSDFSPNGNPLQLSTQNIINGGQYENKRGAGSSSKVSDPATVAKLQTGDSSLKDVISKEGSSNPSTVKTSTGTTEKMDMSKDQALSQLKTAGLEGSKLYKDVEAMTDGPVTITTEKDTAGKITGMTASQEGQIMVDRKGRSNIKENPGSSAVLNQNSPSVAKDAFSKSKLSERIAEQTPGTYKKTIPTRNEALSGMPGMEGSKFYEDIAAMKDGPVNFTTKVGQAGQIESVTATPEGADRIVDGILTQRGKEVKFDGIDAKTGEKLSMTGTAESVNAETGEVKGFRPIEGKSSSGMKENKVMSKSQALSQLSGMKGSNFYRGIEKMGNGPVSLAIEKDTAGNISNVTATQGGRSSKLDQDDTNAMTTFKQGYDSWTGNKSIKEDTDLNVSQHGTKAWSGYQGVTENSDTKTGTFKDIDPETGKEAMFYGRWHSDPATGKQVAADITNINTGRVSTVRTTTGEDGTESKHYGIGTYESGQGGVGKVSNFKELSHDEINKGGFATNRTMGQTGETLLEINKKGQDTSVLHRFRYDNSKEFLTSAAAAYVGNNADLSNMKNDDMAVIIGAGAVSKGMDDLSQTVGVGRNLKSGTGWRQGDKGTTPAPPPGTKTVHAKPKPPRGRGR